MKKTILVVCAFVLMGTLAQAQFKFGVKVGVPFAISDMSAGKVDFDNSRPFNAGATAEFMIPILNMGVSASALFEMQNVKFKGANAQKAVNAITGKTGGDNKVNTSYLVVPVNFKWNFLPLQIIDAYLIAGPRFEIKLTNSEGLDEYTKGMNYGANIGLGVQILKHIQADVTYFYDFGNSFDFGKAENVAKTLFGGDNSSNPHGFLFSVAYMF